MGTCGNGMTDVKVDQRKTLPEAGEHVSERTSSLRVLSEWPMQAT